jgi:hypothetical protein
VRSPPKFFPNDQNIRNHFSALKFTVGA